MSSLGRTLRKRSRDDAAVGRKEKHQKVNSATLLNSKCVTVKIRAIVHCNRARETALYRVHSTVLASKSQWFARQTQKAYTFYFNNKREATAFDNVMAYMTDTVPWFITTQQQQQLPTVIVLQIGLLAKRFEMNKLLDHCQELCSRDTWDNIYLYLLDDAVLELFEATVIDAYVRNLDRIDDTSFELRALPPRVWIQVLAKLHKPTQDDEQDEERIKTVRAKWETLVEAYLRLFTTEERSMDADSFYNLTCARFLPTITRPELAWVLAKYEKCIAKPSSTALSSLQQRCLDCFNNHTMAIEVRESMKEIIHEIYPLFRAHLSAESDPESNTESNTSNQGI
jgi:hypothetical protein